MPAPECQKYQEIVASCQSCCYGVGWGGFPLYSEKGSGYTVVVKNQPVSLILLSPLVVQVFSGLSHQQPFLRIQWISVEFVFLYILFIYMFFNSKNLATCPHHPVMVAAMQYCYQCGQIGRGWEVNWINGGPDRADLMSWSSLWPWESYGCSTLGWPPPAPTWSLSRSGRCPSDCQDASIGSCCPPQYI